jgi:putative ABC transport system permease protein
LRFGRGTWRVVGIFEAHGSSFESEIWGDIHSVQDEAQRGAYYASARIKLAPGANAAALIQRIADDPRINLQAQGEPEYYADEASVADQLRKLVLVVAVIMGIGAIFGAMNTMYAAVAARTVEIATLRALGFSPGAVMLSFLTETIVLAMVAGAIGVVLALPINGFSTTFLNFATFSTLAFSFHASPAIVTEALAFAAAMGLLGGWLPARQAMRLKVVDALRNV